MMGVQLANIQRLNPNSSREDCLKALIRQRRLQVWVHSVIYYNMDANIISDATWSRWAEDLECLQTMYPELANEVEYADVFADFDHSTGSNLPTDNDRINGIAAYLLKITQDKYRR